MKTLSRRSFLKTAAAAATVTAVAPLALVEPVSILPYRPKPSMCAITFPEPGLYPFEIEPMDFWVFKEWVSGSSLAEEQESAIRRLRWEA